MLIADGHHLPADFIATVIAAKGAGRVIVTSDAAPAAGLPPGDYTFFGSRVRLEPPAPGSVCSRLRNLDADTLAGSAATMQECMAYLTGLGLLGEEELGMVGRGNALAVLGER
jgi:N-acetylglucosamine-6-phosphate deacetylase